MFHLYDLSCNFDSLLIFVHILRSFNYLFPAFHKPKWFQQITNKCNPSFKLLMAKLVCNCSLLKDSDYRLKNLSFSNKVCSECYLGIREDVNHLVMQCPAFEGDRAEMLDLLNTIEDDYVKTALLDHQNIFNVLMGKQPNDTPLSSAFKRWAVSSHYISKMYRKITRDR